MTISHLTSSRSPLQTSRLTGPSICCEKTVLNLISKTNGAGPPPTFGPLMVDSHQSDILPDDGGACGRPNTSTISDKVPVLPAGTRGKTCERLSTLRLLSLWCRPCAGEDADWERGRRDRLCGSTVHPRCVSRWRRRSTSSGETVRQNSPVVARDRRDLILCASVCQNANSSSSHRSSSSSLGPTRKHQLSL